MARNFGIFEPVFGEGAPYLKLLHLSDSGTSEVVNQVVNLARTATEPYEKIGILLDDSNWRPHLVGAVALASLNSHAASFLKLWRAIDRGSWVTPQLTSMAFLRDPNFTSQAITRLENLCPLDTSLLLSMTPVERHSAAGPAGGRHRSAKTAAALMGLLKSMSEASDSLALLQQKTDLQKLIDDDFDNSGEVAEHWLTEIKSFLPS